VVGVAENFMSVTYPGFQVGFPKPSLDNPVLFSQFADKLASRLRLQYSESAGYRIKVEKKEDEPKKRKWTVYLYRGLFSGAEISIEPLADTPHIASVDVGWTSRLYEVLGKSFVVLSLPIFLILFLAFAFATRIGFALILTIVIGFIWLLIGVLILQAIAKMVAKLVGNEFDYNRRLNIARELKLVPLPAQSEPNT